MPEGCKDLVEYCGGSNVYIPSKGAIVKKARNRVIRDEFDGGNFREVVGKFGISEVQVRKIVR